MKKNQVVGSRCAFRNAVIFIGFGRGGNRASQRSAGNRV